MRYATKLKMQLDYLPLRKIKWDKPLGKYYNLLLGLLSLYRFEILPEEKGAALVLKTIIKNVEQYKNSSNSNPEDIKFVIDIYYLITCWQQDMGFKTRYTFAIQDKVKGWLINLLIISTNICIVALSFILGAIALRVLGIG